MTRMRTVITALAGCCLLAAGTTYAQSFEGVVKYKMGGAGKTMGEMTQMYKGTKARTEFTGAGGQGGAMIMDMAAQSMIMLIPQQKMYMVMDMKKMAAMAKNMPGAGGQGAPAGGAGAPPAITATGKTETVAGYSCEYYVVGDKQKMEICAAKGLGMFSMGQSPMGRMGANPLAALSDPTYAKIFRDGFFPLKIRNLERNEVVLEATQVEKKTLDASLFVPPSDYKEMQMPSFGQKP